MRILLWRIVRAFRRVVRVLIRVVKRGPLLRLWRFAQASLRSVARGPLLRFRFGSRSRLEPASRVFGLDRGTSITRRYIDGFIEINAHDIRGDVLEIGDPRYTKRHGSGRVDRSDVLNVFPDPSATIVADLGAADALPENAYDCIVCTQTVQCIYEVQAAIANLHRSLRPGDVLLATASGISQISRFDMERWGEYWRFTSLCFKQLLTEAFGDGNVDVETQGNLLAAMALLDGLSAEELRVGELAVADPDYEVMVCARALRVSTDATTRAASGGR